MLSALTHTLVIEILANKGRLSFLVDHLRAGHTAANVADIIFDRCLIVKKSLLDSLSMIRIFHVITIVMAGPLDVLHRCGNALSSSVISFALSSFLRIEEVLSCGLALHLTFLKDFAIGRWLLLEEVKS